MPVQFSSTLSSCKYIFKSGKVAYFLSGKYITSNEDEIKELNAEIAFGHPHISLRGEISEAEVDPLSRLKAQAIAEYLTAQKAAEGKDMGTTDSKSAAVINSALNSSGAATVSKLSGK